MKRKLLLICLWNDGFDGSQYAQDEAVRTIKILHANTAKP